MQHSLPRMKAAAAAGIALLSLFALASCANSDPYIYTSEEFNRGRSDFRVPLQDRDDVLICYSKRTTAWEEITALAGTECGRFGKVAVPEKRDFLTCPVATPTRASFACVAPGAGGL